MKSRFFALLCAALASTLLASCTTTETTTTQTTRRKDVELTSEKRSYSQAELLKRGRPTVGEALAAEDASITVSHGR